MRILVISDTHGKVDSVIESVKNSKLNFDFLIHLGDYVEDGEEIAKRLGLEAHIVGGNGDYFSSYPQEKTIEVEGKKLALSHGHKYGIGYKLDNLIYRGLELKADAILFGHSHIPMISYYENMLIMNPGSPSFPRNIERTRSYGILEIENGEMKAEIVELD